MCAMETERLILRRFSPDDWRDLHEYLSDPSVVEYEPYDAYTEEQAKLETSRRSQQDVFWAACLKEGGKLIGNVYFAQSEPKSLLTWALGYVFNRQYQRKGYATEACGRVVRYGFEQLRAHRIAAMCNPQNVRSWSLLERLGMRREGHLRQNVFFRRDDKGKPIWQDTYEYALLADEWAERRRSEQ